MNKTIENILNLPEDIRKYLRVLIFGTVLLSMIIGIYSLYIDIFNPGSLLARQYADVVNVLFVITIILSFPLIYEKIKRFNKWYEQFDSLDINNKNTMLKYSLKPILIKIGLVVGAAVLLSVILTLVWQVPPEVMVDYQNYYSSPHIFNDTNVTLLK